MIKFFSRIIAAIGNVITWVRSPKKPAGTRGQRVRYGEELPPRTDSVTPPPPPPRLDGQLPQPLPGAGKPIVQVSSESVPVPDTFTVERIENGYRASGPLESGWYINLIIEGDTVRSSSPLEVTDWPFEWTDSNPDWMPAEPPVKWLVTHSDYQPQIAPPIGGVKWIYQGSIDADGTSSTGETVVEVHTQEKEDARRAKQREMRKRRIAG